MKYESSLLNDYAITEAIMNQYRWNARVPDELIIVEVKNGWVELNGEVEWDHQRTVAEKCIQGLIGVKGVSNYILVKEKNEINLSRRDARNETSHMVL